MKTGHFLLCSPPAHPGELSGRDHHGRHRHALVSLGEPFDMVVTMPQQAMPWSVQATS
jgi:hypothetical protein